jgi:hypothetical protein
MGRVYGAIIHKINVTPNNLTFHLIYNDGDVDKNGKLLNIIQYSHIKTKAKCKGKAKFENDGKSSFIASPRV